MINRIESTIILYFKGCLIGVANIIPGVSGGTIAVVLGVYDKLIESLASFFSSPGKRKEYIVFLVKLSAGAVSAIVLLANVMDFLLTHHAYVTITAFTGLIIGGIPSICRAHGDMSIKTRRALIFFIGMIIVLILALLAGTKEAGMADPAAVSGAGRHGYPMLLLAGFFAGGAMIVPGISGSFLLVLMGQYAFVIAAIKSLYAAPLVFVGAGAAAGIFIFSNIIKVCLEKAPAETYYFILGLIFASLWEIFPGMPKNMTTALFAVVTLLCGAGISYFLSKVSAV